MSMVKALTAMLNKSVISAESQETPLDGGTVGNVRLISGTAITSEDEKIPFKIVYKSHEKFERSGDPDSWRREYDLYISELDKSFTGAFRWPACYYTEINENKFEIWMEYINAPFGLNLNVDMLEKAALEIGGWQGKIYAKPELCENMHNKIKNLGDPGFLKRNFNQWHTQTLPYEYIISNNCELPEHIKKYYKENKNCINHDKSIEYNILRTEICDLPQHLKQMLFDVDERQDKIFENFKCLPVVLCQRDYWIQNIFYNNGNIIAIDWDTAGWGYLGEDIAQLVSDDIDFKYFNEYLDRLVPAYYEGFTEFAKVTGDDIKNSKASICDFILIMRGYWKAQKYMFTESTEEKEHAEIELQNFFELKLNSVHHGN
jgi:hypothetical protein